MIDATVLEELKSYKDKDLRDYQQENKQKVYEVWARCQSVMLQMPTGTGKTRLFVSLIKDIFHYSRNHKIALKVLILVHRTELIDQIDDELGFRYGLAHGIIQSGDKERKKYPIQLASVQTLSRRLDNWSDKAFDFIIVDEAHHITADSYQKIIKAFPDAKLLGVSATPVRLSGEGFTGTFEELIVSPSVKWFIDNKYLSQYEYYSVAPTSFIQKEIDGIKKFSNGDYAESELERVCDNDRIRAQVVKTYLDFANDKKGIVYTINKQHNKNLCAEFNEHGISAVAIDSDTPSETRDRYIEDFRHGEFKIICNVNLFTEGFDCPNIEFIQLARPTKSLALYLQQVGRGLRISEDKEKTLFLDNVGLYNRFGFPSSKRMWKHHFEGKHKGNAQIEEKDTDSSSAEVAKKPGTKNLEEGHEKVHLIQTSDEKKYWEERKKQFVDWMNAYHQKYIEAYNKALDLVYVDGLGLNIGRKEQERQYKPFGNEKIGLYSVYMKTMTKEIERTIKETFYNIPKIIDQNTVEYERRRCKSIQEFLAIKNFDMQYDRVNIFRKTFRELIKQYKSLHFSEDELTYMFKELREENLCLTLDPQYNIAMFSIIVSFDSYEIDKRYNFFEPIIRLFLKEVDLEKSETNNDTDL